MTGISRRTLLKGMGAGAAALAIGARFQDKLIIGSGSHKYEWMKSWAKLPDGMKFGNMHGQVVVDSKNRIILNTDTEHAVMIFEPDGRFVKSWGKGLKNGAHDMELFKEGDQELMYLSHFNRHEVLKLTLDGKVLQTIGCPKESGFYKNAAQFRPTAVAAAANGDFYVVDGYGLNLIHQFDSKGKHIRTWGGKGREPGKLKAPHGAWVDTRGKTPVLIVADRDNNRLQIFDLKGEHVGFAMEGKLRQPCKIRPHGTDLVIPELGGRVTIIDKDNKLVTRLGNQPDPKKRAKNGVSPDQWKDGEFYAPHGASWDHDGNLYVMDWNRYGRITKLRRVKK